MKTQNEVRQAFFASHEDAAKEYRTKKDHNDYNATIRTEFSFYVDMLQKDGTITEALAQRVTLGGYTSGPRKLKPAVKRLPKTIDIIAKECFDRVAANSYFSAQVTVNFGMKSERTYYLPFQYGYGEHYQFRGMEALAKEGVLPAENKNFKFAPWRYAQETGIIIRCTKYEKCKQKDVREFGIKPENV